MSTKNLILKALRENNHGYLSGETLSNHLDISRTAVWKAIKALREEGYIIQAVTNKGYKLIEEDGIITEENLRAFLPANYKNNDIHIYDTLDSTNTKAKQLALEKAPHGTTIIALQQTAGKGRLGRSFFSPREGIYLSIIIKPTFDLSRSILVTAAAAVAVAEAVECVCKQKTEIKWVNDVYLKGKKICGILTEGITDFETGQIDAIVIGIGVNTTVKGFPDNILNTVGAVEGDYSKAALAAEIISKTLHFTENLEKRTFVNSYKQKSLVIGKDIRVYKGRYNISPEDELPGLPAKAIGIDDDGCLIVLYPDGQKETLSTGEISIRL